MKLDWKKILKVLGTGVGAIAVVKVIQGIVADLLLSSELKEKLKAGKTKAAALKVAFDVTKIGLTSDELQKWAQAQANALMAASALVIFLAHKFVKQADLKIAAWAGAGFPVALGLSALVDKTGKVANMLDIQIASTGSSSPAGAGAYAVKGDDRAITIPAAQILDFIKARQTNPTVQGHMQDVARKVLNGDDESIHIVAKAFMSGDDEGDFAADYVTRIEEAA